MTVIVEDPRRAQLRALVGQLDEVVKKLTPLSTTVETVQGEEPTIKDLLERKNRGVLPHAADVTLDLAQQAPKRRGQVRKALRELKEDIEEALMVGVGGLTIVDDETKRKIAKSLAAGLARAHPPQPREFTLRPQLSAGIRSLLLHAVEDAATTTQVATTEGKTAERLLLDERIKPLSRERVYRLLTRGNVIEYINCFDELKKDPDTAPNSRTILNTVLFEENPPAMTLTEQVRRKASEYKKYLMQAVGEEQTRDKTRRKVVYQRRQHSTPRSKPNTHEEI